MTLCLPSPCKVNLLLNILGKRPDGFHELETLMHPVQWCDELSFIRKGGELNLTCSNPNLPLDSGNLVHRAATKFFEAAQIHEGVGIHLEKRIPLAAGLGGGSGNAAITLRGLNELFGLPLSPGQIGALAASLGSDINFFLQDKPALATGRGEAIKSLSPFPCLAGRAFFLFHPGFGISTPWAYQNLARFPSALKGQPGRAEALAALLSAGPLPEAASHFYNALEFPAFEKYPILKIYQEFLSGHGAVVSLMSGSGSTTFAIAENLAAAENLGELFRKHFGDNGWSATVAIPKD